MLARNDVEAVLHAASGIGIAMLCALSRRGPIEPVSRQGSGSDPLSWFLPSISHV